MVGDETNRIVTDTTGYALQTLGPNGKWKTTHFAGPGSMYLLSDAAGLPRVDEATDPRRIAEEKRRKADPMSMIRDQLGDDGTSDPSEFKRYTLDFCDVGVVLGIEGAIIAARNYSTALVARGLVPGDAHDSNLYSEVMRREDMQIPDGVFYNSDNELLSWLVELGLPPYPDGQMR